MPTRLLALGVLVSVLLLAESGSPVDAAAAPAQLSIYDIDGRAFLVADDGAYLGKISSNAFDYESICNGFGPYGNPFSGTSIRNDFAPYGNPFSALSADNSFTSSPPQIIYQRKVVGYLTKNQFLPSALDPDLLFAAYDCR
jgi:hypothetical protein